MSITLFLQITSCQTSYEKGSFGYDLERLQTIEGLEVLQDGEAMIAISGIFQGRVFTSSANGLQGKSYGWVNWDLIEKQAQETSIAGLGGESRIWFGPEFGEFSLCFEKGAEQIDENMTRPYDLNHKKFTLLKKTENGRTVGGIMELKNASNFIFNVDIERTITLLTQKQVEENLGLSLNDKVAHVGFSASTTVKNTGQKAFKKETGLIALWELGCMLTSPDNVVILPLRQPIDSITEYFAPTTDRIKIDDQIVYYHANANGLSKIGIPPQYCKKVMGSYSPSQNLLNIVTFTFENDNLYVNSIPENKNPYQGDVINIFNGEVSDQWNLPFYEFESSSSAKELKPNESIQHQQTTYHFEGTFEELNKIAQQVLGVRLSEIPEW